MYSIEAINNIVNGRFTKGQPVCISEFSIDSRFIEYPDCTLFFALKGPNHNGHEYIKSIYDRGGRAFVVSEEDIICPELNEANFILVHDTLTALQNLAEHHRLISKAKIIGITGSNGKTIVKEWLYQVLNKDFIIHKSPRSYNSQVGVPLSLLGIEQDTEMALIEAGISEIGEMERLEKMIKPDIGIFTHWGDSHAENFENDNQRLLEKAILFKDCNYVIGQNTETFKKLVSTISEKTLVITWGESHESDILFIISNYTSEGTIVNVSYAEKKFIYDLIIPFKDRASIENAMSVVAFMLAENYDPEIIKERIIGLFPIAMRLEIKEGVNDCILINDYYNSDPGSFQLALNTMSTQDPSKERMVILSDFVDIGNSKENLYELIAEKLNNAGIQYFIGIGKDLIKNRHFFPENSRFYTTTEEFLKFEQQNNFNDLVILIKGARKFQLEYIASFLQKQTHGTILEVDMNAMIQNLNYFRSKTDARIAVMVKAFTYGSGSKEVASLLQYHRVDYLMVAYADEGIELRAAGITTPIAVMNPENDAFDKMITFNLEPEIYAVEQLINFNSALKKHGIKSYPIHIKLNTGMNRSGFDKNQLEELLDFFKTRPSVYIKSIFSHLAGSDETKHDEFTLYQIHFFEEMANEIQSRFNYKIWKHILNSAGIERFPQYHFDMVRLGIGLHGISYNHAQLSPVSTFKTHIASIRQVDANQTIGYGRQGVTKRISCIAVIPVGYADGLNRHLSNGIGEVFINGKRAPIIGNICMDATMIDVTDIDIKVGDDVEIFGKNISINELAEKLGTIPYEILTSISQRVKRVYYQE